MAIRVKAITYSAADIIAMYNTPQVALAAPASGYINKILGITHWTDYNSAAYTGASIIWYGKPAAFTPNVLYESTTLPATVNESIALSRNPAAATIYSTIEDLYVTTDAQAAAGNSPIIAYIVYEEKQIDP